MGWKAHPDGSESGSESGSNNESSDDGSSGSSSGSGDGSGSGSRSGSKSESGSASGSASESDNEKQTPTPGAGKDCLSRSDSQDSSGSSPNKASKQSRLNEIKNMWEEMPELYGVRRSTRERKEVARLQIRDEDSDDRKKRKGRRGSRISSGSWQGQSSSEEESDSDDSESSSNFKPSRTNRQPSRRTTKPARKPARSTRQRRAPPRGRRHHYEDDDSESDSDTMKRSASRRQTAKKVSYKEDSEGQTDSSDLIEVETKEEENNAETIERVYNHRMGRKGATGSKTAVYNCQDHGNPNDGLDPSTEETELQYLIKWKNWSHIHNTWECESELISQKVNGIKKLENYKKRQEEIREFKSSASPEDIEYFECQEENMELLIEEHMKVERICTHTANKTEASSFPDYLIKWMGLPYSECTWEDGELVTRKYKDALDAYNRRNKSQKIPSKYMKALKHRPKFLPLKEQPTYLGSDDLQLRDYQLDGLNWLIHSWCRGNSVILADEMGLGKTIQTIAFLSYLMNDCQLYGPFLLVVPLSTIVTWQREFQIWAPDMNVVVYVGDLSSRNTIRQYEWCHPGNKRLKFNVIVTTYEILLKDKSFLGSVSWSALGVDEAHRLKNDDSLLYKSLVEFDTNHRILITGTPLQNSLKELWSLLHFIMPNKFDDWEEFEAKHKQSEKSGFSTLHKELEPFLLRRVKKDVEKSLPAKTEQILRVELTSLQKQYYRWILAKNYKALSKGLKGSVSSFINIVMELKKCCNHAYLTRPPEENDPKQDSLEALIKGSGKLILLDKLLMRLKETNHRVLIFSQMVRMLDILADYMQLRHFQFQRLDGSIRGEVRKNALDHFNAEDSKDFCFLLSTRAGGLGLNLATADTVIIFDSDWNPQNDLQAQARAHRIGQKNQVSVYRLVSKLSVEEDIIERAKRKMVLDHLVIQRMDTTGRTVLNRGSLQDSGKNNPFNKEELSSILKFGAEDLFKETEEEEDLQVNLDDILQRAETRESEDHLTAGEELLSQFKVVSFDNLESEEIEQNKTEPERDWEQIIPEDERRKVDEEELQQQLMEMNLPPRSRKAVKQFNIYDSDEASREGGKAKEEESESSEDSEDEDRPKRRGRPPAKAKETIKGFVDAEIRRFIKSYRKFGNPWDRLEPIAFDAELQEKSQADLKRLAQLIKDGCEQAMAEHEEKLKEEPTPEGNGPGGKKTPRGPSFKLGGVTVNAKAVTNSVNDLAPLAKVVPAEKKERDKFRIDFYVKKVHWDCDWDNDDDSRLLRGIYENGMGNWEAMKMDPDLGLGDKILPDGDTTKPQAKHLQTRADYLLKALRRNLGGEVKEKPKKPSSARKAKKSDPKSVAIIDEQIDDDSSDDNEEKENTVFKKLAPPEVPKKKKKEKKDGGEGQEESDVGEKKPKKEKKEKKKSSAEIVEDGEIESSRDGFESEDKPKKKKKKKEKTGPMHFTANHEPVAIGPDTDFDTELESEVFAQCKDKMRPVKKTLKRLDNPDTNISDKDRVQQFTACLLKIGDRISECLAEYNDLEKIKEWRSNLWVFVSKFTEFDAKKLHKWFKHAVHKRKDGHMSEEHKDKSHKKSKHHHKHHEHGANDLGKRKAEETTPNQKVKERDKAMGRPDRDKDHAAPPPKKNYLSSDDTSRDSWQSSRDRSTGSSFHNAHNPARESSYASSSPADRWQHASPLAQSSSASSYSQNSAYSSYGRAPSSFGRGAFHPRHQGERPHHTPGPGGDYPKMADRPGGDYPKTADHPRLYGDLPPIAGGDPRHAMEPHIRHNSDPRPPGYGFHRPDPRGDFRDPRDPRSAESRDPRGDPRDPRGEHRKHYQRSEFGGHGPRPPDHIMHDRPPWDRKRRPPDGYGRDGRPPKEPKYYPDQGRYPDGYH